MGIFRSFYAGWSTAFLDRAGPVTIPMEVPEQRLALELDLLACASVARWQTAMIQQGRNIGADLNQEFLLDTLIV